MPDETERPVIVYLSGNNGSGKSSLGHALALRTGFQHLPAEQFETSYLRDLFVQQRRWSFEAQAHFLTFKISQVQNAVASQARVFIDRSPYEDAEVFARYFYELGKLDRRSYRTYSQLYRTLIRTLPDPDLIIYCSCPMTRLVERVKRRERDYEELYPKNHLRHLDHLYRAWLRKICRVFPGRVFGADTTGYTLDDSDPVLENMAADVLYLIRTHQTTPQIPLFQDEVASTAQGYFFAPTPFHHSIRPVQLSGHSEGRRFAPKPVAYIAAPFTGKATSPNGANRQETPTTEPGTLFLTSKDAPHGVIADVGYRGFLEAIEKAAQSCGYETILPHRDVNRWGDRHLTPRQACAECTQGIFNSDLLIAFPQSSFGAHYEVGVAIGYGMPVLLLTAQGTERSFIMEGMSSQPRVSEIHFTSLTDLINRLTLRLIDAAASFRI